MRRQWSLLVAAILAGCSSTPAEDSSTPAEDSSTPEWVQRDVKADEVVAQAKTRDASVLCVIECLGHTEKSRFFQEPADEKGHYQSLEERLCSVQSDGLRYYRWTLVHAKGRQVVAESAYSTHASSTEEAVEYSLLWISWEGGYDLEAMAGCDTVARAREGVPALVEVLESRFSGKEYFDAKEQAYLTYVKRPASFAWASAPPPEDAAFVKALEDLKKRVKVPAPLTQSLEALPLGTP
jgi:hypothetical protein